MKFILTSILMLTMTLFAKAQYFSGSITKKTTIVAKQQGVNTDSILDGGLGTSSTYLITDGYYKSSYHRNGKMTYSYTYHKGEDKMFDNNAEDPYITYRDATRPFSTKIERKILHDNTITVMGYKCFLVKTKYEDHTAYNYYTNELKVKYDNFKDHAYADWYTNLEQLDGAQLLKVVSEYENYTEISEATKVDIREVDVSEFDLPKSKPVFASFQALDEMVSMGKIIPSIGKCYTQKVRKASSKSRNAVPFKLYVKLIVKADGSVDFLQPEAQEDAKLHKAAIDVIKNCKLNFIAGKIDGKPVASETYFPVEFRVEK